jgi:hypothetical protein
MRPFCFLKIKAVLPAIRIRKDFSPAQIEPPGEKGCWKSRHVFVLKFPQKQKQNA